MIHQRYMVLTGIAIIGCLTGCIADKEASTPQDTSFAFFEEVKFMPERLELQINPKYSDLPIQTTSKNKPENGKVVLAPGDDVSLYLGLPGNTVFQYITFDALTEAEADHLRKAGIQPEILLRTELDIYKSACCPEHRIPRVHYIIPNDELPADFHIDTIKDEDLLISLHDCFIVIEDKKCTVDLMMSNNFLCPQETGPDRREKLHNWVYPAKH